MDRGFVARFRSLNCDSGYGVTLLATLTAVGLLAVGGDTLRHSLQYDRAALAAGQWWRLLGAHVVHLGLRHLLYNLAGLVLLWALYARAYRPWRWVQIALCTILTIDAALWLGSPGVLWYAGMSGALHGIWSAGAWAQWRQHQALRATALLLLALKLCYEHWRGASAFVADMPVVLDAHLYGALGGLVLPLLWQFQEQLAAARYNRRP